MPVFHTKTIESILEPVAQQVIKMLEDLLSLKLSPSYLFHREIRLNLFRNFEEYYTLIYCENLFINKKMQIYSEKYLISR